VLAAVFSGFRPLSENCRILFHGALAKPSWVASREQIKNKQPLKKP
jgi:hypothetical protein